MVETKPRRFDRSRPFVILCVAAAAVSAFAPISFDEGNWLAITRRMDAGAQLYSDLIDNKSPFLYWTVRILDHLPGGFTLARGILFGTLIASIAFAATSLAKRLGLKYETSLAIGLLTGAAVAFQSVFVLNTETPVVLLVLTGLLLIASERAVIGASVAAIAVVIDIRALAFAPALILFAAERRGRRDALRVATAFILLSGAWFAIIVSSPRLLYALLELNAASRGPLSSWRPGAVVAVAVVALLPVIVGLIALLPGASWERAFHRPWSGAVLLATGLAVSIASIYPFFKYWILIAPSFAIIAASVAQKEASSAQLKKALAILAFIPIVIISISGSISEHHTVSRYEHASHALARYLHPGDTFVAFDPQPFVTTFVPRHAVLPWAVLDFLGVKTSHRRGDLATVARAIDDAVAVEDDGALSAEERVIEPRYRSLWRLYREKLKAFPCVRRTEGVTLRLRRDRCV